MKVRDLSEGVAGLACLWGMADGIFGRLLSQRRHHAECVFSSITLILADPDREAIAWQVSI